MIKIEITEDCEVLGRLHLAGETVEVDARLAYELVTARAGRLCNFINDFSAVHRVHEEALRRADGRASGSPAA